MYFLDIIIIIIICKRKKFCTFGVVRMISQIKTPYYLKKILQVCQRFISFHDKIDYYIYDNTYYT